MRNALLSAALVAAAAPVFAGGDKKLPKKPDRPLTIAVTASPRPAPTTEVEIQAAKELSDSLADIQSSLRDKRKDWFSLVSDPEQAEIILEVAGRAREPEHGTVIRGRAFVLSLEPTTILGQGALNPNSLDVRVWRQAANESFAQAAVLDKTDADALFERGLCNVKQGQVDWAIADFSEVIRQKPDRAEAWWNRGLCYGKQKKTRLASADRAQALKLDPGLARKK